MTEGRKPLGQLHLDCGKERTVHIGIVIAHDGSHIVTQAVGETYFACREALVNQYAEWVERTNDPEGLTDELGFLDPERAEATMSMRELVSRLRGEDDRVSAFDMFCEDLQATEMRYLFTELGSFTAVNDIVPYATGDFKLTS